MISVIMPYYKKKDFIEEALKSVLNQTYKDFEIIIVYDDELKEDLNFIKDLTKLDQRIKLIINDKNIGAGPSRNKGIKFSDREFLAFIDCDDIWYETKLEEQINFLQI